ncbi:Vacuolar protein 8 [Rhodosporidiobolus nylandii]
MLSDNRNQLAWLKLGAPHPQAVETTASNRSSSSGGHDADVEDSLDGYLGVVDSPAGCGHNSRPSCYDTEALAILMSTGFLCHSDWVAHAPQDLHPLDQLRSRSNHSDSSLLDSLLVLPSEETLRFLVPDMNRIDSGRYHTLKKLQTFRRMVAEGWRQTLMYQRRTRNKRAIVDAGAAERIKYLVLRVPVTVQSEVTACAAVLGLSEDIKTELLDMGICEVLIPLTASPSVEVQGNSAAAIGNLSSKTDDYSAFSNVWGEPAGGLHGYLVRFLESDDTTFSHIAVWTLVQLLESQDAVLENLIRSSPSLLPLVRKLASQAPHPSSSSASSLRTGSDVDEAIDGGEREIVELARTAWELIEPGAAGEQ